MSATVYFSPVITPEKVLDMFKLVDTVSYTHLTLPTKA